MDNNNIEKFTDSQLKGNWGEQFIASQLTACGCLVRHVTSGHDSGIDLYCESIKNGKPFLHFFVQVKTSQDYIADKPTCSFYEEDAEKILYWKSQPVPVFICLVPDERRSNNVPFFICSVLDFIGKKKRIESKLKISSPKRLEKEFFEDKNFKGLLIDHTFKWSLVKGHLSPLPAVDTSLLRWFPEKIMNKPEYLNHVSLTLHDTLWRICEDSLLEIYDNKNLRLKSNNIDRSKITEMEPYIAALESLLRTNENSNVSRITIGLYYALKNEYKKAKQWIEKGIEIVKKNITDPKYKNDSEHLQKQLKWSQQYLSKIKKRL